MQCLGFSVLLPYVEGLEFPQVAGFKSDPVLAFREDACPRSGFVGRTRSHAEAGDDENDFPLTNGPHRRLFRMTDETMHTLKP